MIGYRFGKLIIVEYAGIKSSQKSYICLCDCGNKTVVLSGNLKKHNSTSCGCSRKKTCSTRMKTLNLRHGETDTKLWQTWKGIVERTTCITSKAYEKYGARGIGIHKEWLIYENFAAYIGQPPSKAHTIDRINNLHGYHPGNIRWATKKEQASNRSTNVRVSVSGEALILSDAAKALGISKSTASRWLRSGRLKRIEQ